MLNERIHEMDILNSSLSNRVYYAARDGMAMSLFTLLADRTKEEINTLLNTPITVEDGQKITPLIVASRQGCEKVVKMILSKFEADIEQEGVVNFDTYVIEGASALWCAAGAGHLNVVKTLVNKGANVNHATRSNSTPLRAACFEGRLDIVKYLINHGGDVTIPNIHGSTCLMISAYKGYYDIVRFLLERGADANCSAKCGTTAMHFAAERNRMDIVKELFKRGAKFVKNGNGMTPLMSAAERSCEATVKYLINLRVFSRQEIIDAYELLGASFANDKENYSLVKSHLYLTKGMALRYIDRKHVLRKRLGPPIRAYEYWVETQTPEQLNAIQLDENALHMESLAIRERLLGPANPEISHPIIFRGAVFADNDRFDRCIELWLRALELRQNNKISVVKDLLRFAQIFSQIVHMKAQLDFDFVTEVLNACIKELIKNREQLEEKLIKTEIEAVMTEMDCNITTTLYILTILSKVMKHRSKRPTATQSTISTQGNGVRSFQENYNTIIVKTSAMQIASEEDLIMEVEKLVYKLNRMDLKLRNGQTLLHLAVNSETPVDDFHTNDVCRFPCADTARLLVRCGADVDAMDIERNTPLHVIVDYQKPVSDFFTLHAIIVALYEAGAHMDIVNRFGHTPLDACSTGVSEIILRTLRKISLKCLAARVVKLNNIDYKGLVPVTLESFIELHGTGENA